MSLAIPRKICWAGALCTNQTKVHYWQMITVCERRKKIWEHLHDLNPTLSARKCTHTTIITHKNQYRLHLMLPVNDAIRRPTHAENKEKKSCWLVARNEVLVKRRMTLSKRQVAPNMPLYSFMWPRWRLTHMKIARRAGLQLSFTLSQRLGLCWHAFDQ